MFAAVVGLQHEYSCLWISNSNRKTKH